MYTQQKILQFLRSNKEYLQKNFHLTKIGIFGSYAKNEQLESSDIDLLIELEAETPNIFELKQNLKNYIKDQLNIEVDICREKYLKPYIKSKILDETIYV